MKEKCPPLAHALELRPQLVALLGKVLEALGGGDYWMKYATGVGPEVLQPSLPHSCSLFSSTLTLLGEDEMGSVSFLAPTEMLYLSVAIPFPT